jgi:uncharacterized protein (DUF488 family)
MDTTLFTIGYGGRAPAVFVSLLHGAGVRTVVDVRARPDRASMGAYVRARLSDKGIEALLRAVGIGYVSMPELGNPFMDDAFADDWQRRYAELLAAAGPLLMVRLLALATAGTGAPLCLLCAEQDPARCHRTQVAAVLEAQGMRVQHLGGPSGGGPEPSTTVERKDN